MSIELGYRVLTTLDQQIEAQCLAILSHPLFLALEAHWQRIRLLTRTITSSRCQLLIWIGPSSLNSVLNMDCFVGRRPLRNDGVNHPPRDDKVGILPHDDEVGYRLIKILKQRIVRERFQQCGGQPISILVNELSLPDINTHLSELCQSAFCLLFNTTQATNTLTANHPLNTVNQRLNTITQCLNTVEPALPMVFYGTPTLKLAYRYYPYDHPILHTLSLKDQAYLQLTHSNVFLGLCLLITEYQTHHWHSLLTRYPYLVSAKTPVWLTPEQCSTHRDDELDIETFITEKHLTYQLKAQPVLLSLFLCRWIHIIKSLLRDLIGRYSTVNALEYHVNHWLGQYCASTVCSANTRARYPLAFGYIKVKHHQAEQLGCAIYLACHTLTPDTCYTFNLMIQT